MGLNIKNPRVHELAREAARRTGKSQTGAVEEALERLLEDLNQPAQAEIQAKIARINTAVAEFNKDLTAEASGFVELLATIGITIEPVTQQQALVAREAYRDYGQRSRHPARLNFGDCFAYALARDLAEPLLFNGDDFVHTDVRSAL